MLVGAVAAIDYRRLYFTRQQRRGAAFRVAHDQKGGVKGIECGGGIEQALAFIDA